jgi:hypothetical protein
MNWQSRTAKINVGDEVKYSRDWLRSTSQITGDIPFAKGTVTEIKDYGSTSIAIIDWGNPEIPSKVNTKNLTLANRPEVER